MPHKFWIADFRVTAGTPFYSFIYTLQSRDLDTQKAFDTSGANNLMYNSMKSPIEKIIHLLYILFKPNPIIINLTRYDCFIRSRRSIIFTRRNRGKGWGGGGGGEGEVTKGVVVGLGWGENFWQCLVYIHVYIHVICINV